MSLRSVVGAGLLAVAALAAAPFHPCAPVHLVAQTHPWGAGWTAGLTDIGALNTDASLPGGGAPAPIEPGAGALLALHVDRWYLDDGRLGVRVQGAYQQPRLDWGASTRRIDTFSADLSLLVRPLSPDDEPPLIPYLALGAGGIWYDLGRGRETSFADADARHDGRQRLTPVGLVAIGFDVPIPWSWYRQEVRVRVEAADHVSLRSPLRRLSDGDRHGPVHHLRFTIGLHSAFRL